MHAEDTVCKRRFEGRLLSRDSTTLRMRIPDDGGLGTTRATVLRVPIIDERGPDDSLTIEMRWRDVAALEVSRRRPRPAGARAWSGAKWGMLVGGVTGAAIGAAVGSDGALWTSVADSRIGRVAPR